MALGVSEANKANRSQPVGRRDCLGGVGGWQSPHQRRVNFERSEKERGNVSLFYIMIHEVVIIYIYYNRTKQPIFRVCNVLQTLDFTALETVSKS